MLQHFDNLTIDSMVNHRIGEVKLGELISFASKDYVKQTHHKFAILGVPEDVGVLANNGIGGAHTAWESFLKSFLNIQANMFAPVDAIVLWGWVGTQDSVDAYDTVVEAVVADIIANALIPIVIGGGHNNAYPLLAALAKHNKSTINCINIDPHADMRKTDERHSGNGFSCAIRDSYLGKCAMIGLHQSYNNQYMIEQMIANENLMAIWWESVFLDGSYTWTQAIQQGVAFVGNTSFGVELDLDSIEQVLTSAMTPVGISAQQAMQALYMLGMHPQSAYLHLPEGILHRADGLQQATIGKLLSYLTMSFIKGKIYE